MPTPADLEMSNSERRWLEAAFQATADTRLVTKTTFFNVDKGAEKIMLVLGTSSELPIYKDKEPSYTHQVFGSFLIDRDVMQYLADGFAQNGVFPSAPK